MPLTSKGQEILANMTKEYGGKKGESVFYASKNAGKISGVDRADKIAAIADSVTKFADGVACLEGRMYRRRNDGSLEYHKLESDYANKTAQKTDEGARKVERKTEPQ